MSHTQDHSCPNYKELDIRITHIEEDVKELKQDGKERNEKIDRSLEMTSQSLVKLTTMVELNNFKMDTVESKLDSLESDIKKSPSNKADEDKKWYQKNISILIYFLIGIIMFLLGMKSPDIITFLKAIIGIG